MYASELRTCGLGAFVAVLLAGAAALVGMSSLTVEGLWPRR